MKHEKQLLTFPEAILFDWDNTLVSSFEIIKKSMNAALSYFDKPVWSDAEIRQYTQLSAKDGLPVIFGDHWPKALDIFSECYQNNVANMLTALPGALSLLQAGKQANIPMAVISNKRSKFLHHEIKQFGWESFFQVIIGSGDLAEDKPSPLPVYHVLEQMGLEAGPAIWFVGDAPVDWHCAEASGCLPIPIGEGVVEAKNYAQFVANYLELEKILLKR
ncbi:HAD family hydrolase [Candidatus Paracaedibacter symbiosus]|uniref:HAD family hydrolase n=1 Tax=Candidatus Paracaedibacter symbiosus TaxID=244582 RepID=UPI00068F0099|nr:HAD-IA family hydrolase [Candidatus Paracaedibacter symbiosus]